MLSNSSKVTRNLRALCLVFVICSLKRITIAQKTVAEGCDYTSQVTSQGLLIGTYTPYEPYSSCRYNLVAPLDHIIIADCIFDFPKEDNQCTTEYFYFDRDGSKSLWDSEQLCGNATIRRRSTFRSAVIAYVSNGNQGKFICRLRIERQPCDCGWSVDTKIVNGQEVSVNEYPSMVALRDRLSNRPLFCAAVIISRRYLLTAAHCAEYAPHTNYIEAWVGRHNLTSNFDTKYADVYYISKIIKHPEYKPEPSHNDIALMKTTRRIEYSRGVGPICLPPPSDIDNDFSYSDGDLIGWGANKFSGPASQTLQKITIMTIDNEVCIDKYENLETIYPGHICTFDTTTSKKDSCQFDSGGPLVYNDKRQFLIGIISHGKACAVGGSSIGINTRLTEYLPWIYQNIDNSLCMVKM